MNYSGLEWFAGVALGRMLFSLLEGTLLSLLVSLAIRFLPGKSSQTRFILWLTALLASAALPFLLYTGWSQGVPGGVAKHEAVLISAGLAICIFLGWFTLAIVGLVRVAVGVAGLRRLRKASSELDPELLPVSLRAEVELLQAKRKITLLVSSSLSVPTAIGFLRPAVVLPQWLVDEAGEAELKHLVLHELAHLRRWDDWTNLAQKVIKALLFFHPAIWWMERRLSLDREMACDDAVLASTGTPRIYAELLARMAEKSFLRRQIALAQAAVGHLT
ncbi:MAG TPA: M56 family metallopeptidase, partial [Terriglobales bacterium]|nr:M56 family metallopeptidase [Terriglobales bacterium]